MFAFLVAIYFAFNLTPVPFTKTIAVALKGKTHILSSFSLSKTPVSLFSLCSKPIWFSLQTNMSDPMDLLRSNLSRVRIPEPTNRIYKQECCLSFDTPVISSLPLVFCLVPEKKKTNKEESVVRERKLIFLALCYSFLSFLFLFSFS